MRRTVFVVGAGASTDFGLPLGSALVDTIRDMVAAEVDSYGQRPLISAAMRAGLTGSYDAAVRDIAGGMNVARSIDRFLHSRRDRPLVNAIGKSAIAVAIAQSESNSILGRADLREWDQAQATMAALRGTWLGRLFSILQEGYSPNESDQILSDVSFITFNYDRVIERYLMLAFEHSMAQRPDRAHELVAQKLPIHIYGSLGPISSTDEEGMAFGIRQDMIHHIAYELAADVRTFTESQDSRLLAEAHELIAASERVVFLGFAFDHLNVQALFPTPLRPDQHYAGTELFIGPAERQNMIERIGGAGATNRMRNMNCADYIGSFDFKDAVGL